MTELAKQMQEHGIRDPADLGEFDIEWVNPATMKDIETVAAEHNWKIFGLKAWEWSKIRGKDLLNVHTFEVDYIILNKDEAKADELIKTYRDKQQKIGNKFDSKIAWAVVNGLSALALMSCTWV